MTPASVISPEDLGAPSKFKSWRPQQALTFSRLVSSDKRVDGCALPTGVGKSLLGWCYSRLMGMRTAILSPNKGLQDQYQRDLEQSGLVDLRGMGNYPCRLLTPGPLYYAPSVPKCDVGPCLDGEPCIYSEVGCAYFDRLKIAQEEDIFSTNYDMWAAHPELKRDLLICDEAHQLPGIVTAMAGVTFSNKEVTLKPEMEHWGLGDWALWGIEQLKKATVLLQSPRLSPREKRDVRSLKERFQRLSQANLDDWGVDWQPKQVVLEPISPAPYTESLLFRGATRIVLMGATLRPAHLIELGIPLDQYQFHETDSPFPVSSRPIYWVKSVKLTEKTSHLGRQTWAGTIDQIIATRQDRKGIIHTVSYKRARELQAMSRFASIMLLHDSYSARDTVEQFRKSKAPTILVSPSVHTGWDFPMQEAEYQIIAKVPFQPTHTGLAKARQESDKLWLARTTAATLVQMSGRIVRGDGDAGETLIVDDTVNWLFSKYQPFFPRWWRQAYKPCAAPPMPPPHLGGTISVVGA